MVILEAADSSEAFRWSARSAQVSLPIGVPRSPLGPRHYRRQPADELRSCGGTRGAGRLGRRLPGSASRHRGEGALAPEVAAGRGQMRALSAPFTLICASSIQARVAGTGATRPAPSSPWWSWFLRGSGPRARCGGPGGSGRRSLPRLVRRFDRVRERRAETQGVIAERAGVAIPTLSMIEGGHSNATWATVRDIGATLGVSVAELAKHSEKHDVTRT
jgi:DNA-binding XRE family transcriptional regulator